MAKGGHRRLPWITLLALVAVGAALAAVPRVQMVICRIGGFWSEDDHPSELVDAWVGWATGSATHCRLELGADGMGRRVFWYGRGPDPLVEQWRVASWTVEGNDIAIEVEGRDRRDRLSGRADRDALSLQFLGREDPGDLDWRGAFLLVRERVATAAQRDVARAIAAPR